MTNNFYIKLSVYIIFKSETTAAIYNNVKERNQTCWKKLGHEEPDSVTWGFDILDNFDIYIKMGFFSAGSRPWDERGALWALFWSKNKGSAPLGPPLLLKILFAKG